MADDTRGRRRLAHRGAGTSHDVRVFTTSRYKGQRKTTYTVRWSVAGVRSQRTFSTAKLADAFRSDLLVASREGQAFDIASGLPLSLRPSSASTSWYDHATAYVAHKWPTSSGRHRKGIAEALVPVTMALVQDLPERPRDEELRRALYEWSFANRGFDNVDIPDEHFMALRWIRQASLPLGSLSTAHVRHAVDALMVKMDGTAAAPATITRKRATFNNALEWGVELELLQTNPLTKFRTTRSPGAGVVERNVVINPAQARLLLNKVWLDKPDLAAFFACLYYAGLRPAEARNLRMEDCDLPLEGWGGLTLRGSHQDAGTTWTDSGSVGEQRALKHRPVGHSRWVPAHPELVRMLRRHLDCFQTGREGHLFVSRTGRAGVPIAPSYGGPVRMNYVYRAWAQARVSVLSPAQVESPLARRPYDLRHACVSTWLNAGVSPAQVAEWAGHSVQVLLRVYAKCIDGEAEASKRLIEAALGGG